MRTYTVYPNSKSQSRTAFEVQADDVDLDSCNGNGDSATAYWNFLVQDGDGQITVAAHLFTDVAYITSVITSVKN